MTNTANTTPTTWLTTREMAARIGLHEITLLKMARRRRIPCLRAGRAIRFNPEQVEAALMQTAANDNG